MDRVTLSALPAMLTAMWLIPAGDAAGKLLTQAGVAPIFVAWSRFAVGALLVAPALGRGMAWGVFADWRVWLRAGLLAGGISSILTALRYAPIADVYGAFFTGPILAYGLSALLLGERVSLGRSLLLLAGFGGVLLVVRPGFGMTPGLGWAALAGAFYGCFLVASRWLAPVASARSLLVSQLAIGAVLTAPARLASIPPITWEVAALILASAAASMLGNLLLLRAMVRAEASRLAPFVYTQLVAATVYGVAIFDTWPDALTLAGLGVLLSSGLAGLTLERRGGAAGGRRPGLSGGA